MDSGLRRNDGEWEAFAGMTEVERFAEIKKKGT